MFEGRMVGEDLRRAVSGHKGEDRISTVQVKEPLHRLLRKHSPLLPKKPIRNKNTPGSRGSLGFQRQLGREHPVQEITTIKPALWRPIPFPETGPVVLCT
jgi:hypothetical protein